MVRPNRSTLHFAVSKGTGHGKVSVLQKMAPSITFQETVALGSDAHVCSFLFSARGKCHRLETGVPVQKGMPVLPITGGRLNRLVPDHTSL